MDRQFVKLVARFCECVPDLDSAEMQVWIDDPSGFKAGLLFMKPAKPELKVWRTIKLGTGLRTADDFRSALSRADMKLGGYANDMLGKPAFTASETEQEVDLVVASVAELGFKKGAKYSDICVRAKELGLELCPNEVGPQLRLQYTDQPMNEWLWVAMEPIVGSGGGRGVWHVERCDGGLWLYSVYFNPGDVWRHDGRFVFVRRK